jgi:hypothetical protein
MMMMMMAMTAMMKMMMWRDVAGCFQVWEVVSKYSELFLVCSGLFPGVAGCFSVWFVVFRSFTQHNTTYKKKGRKERKGERLKKERNKNVKNECVEYIIFSHIENKIYIIKTNKLYDQI